MGVLGHWRGRPRELGGDWGSWGARGDVRASSGSRRRAMLTWGTSEPHGGVERPRVALGRRAGLVGARSDSAGTTLSLAPRAHGGHGPWVHRRPEDATA
eukprot:3365965-Pyramimonas_sp.AAC.1